MTTTENPQVSPIAQIRALYDRLAKAEELVAKGKVEPIYNMPRYFIVQGKDTRYLVNGSCNCPDATHRTELLKGYCKHRLAVLLYAEQQGIAAPATLETASPEIERTLEDKLEDLYPKARPASLPR
jgi:predicted nucleic acid-binding Zn finger protein